MASAHAAAVINEIMYRPGTGYPTNPELEFIEIHNPDSSAANISGWAITTGADFTFPAGTSIPAGGFVVVSPNPAALQGSASVTALGPWKAGAGLSDRGEKITLAKPDGSGGWETVDEVAYADEGDWATRTRDSLGGWSWTTDANGNGRSLERRNPALTGNNGQNWGASNALGGSPGAVNSLRSANIAPLISSVKHSPAVPTSGDAVTISAVLTDESASPAATLFWRTAASTTPGAFQPLAMSADAGGKFVATLPAMADKTIVEFYVSATDGTSTRTWPAATSEGQTANATYQVDNEVVAGNAPAYRLILTGAENAAYNTLASTNPQSNRQFNTTLVVTRGTETTIRYRVSLRIRGQSSRSYTFKPLRISIPTDDRWDDVTDFALNPKYPWLQFLAMRLQRAAGLPAADVTPVELRRNGVEYTTGSTNAEDYGRWVRVEDINTDYVDHHWPNAVDGQVYRKEASSYWSSAANAPTNPDTLWSGWSKQNHRSLNDWSDVINFSRLWQQTAASHFTGATAGNVQSGNWNGVAFSDAEIATLSTVVDFDHMARWFAVMAIIQNTEPNVANGSDDDYAAAFISDGTNRRFQLLPHDMDNVLGKGDEARTATATGLYRMTDATGAQGGGMGATSIHEPLLPLFGNTTTPGNAAFRAAYLLRIREMFGGVFDADTSTNPNPPFYVFVDNHLGDWVPEATRNQVKAFMTARQSHLLGLIGAAKIAPAAATSTATRAAASTPTLRINEVLATNLNAHANGATRPDVIELFNASGAAIDLAGKSLTDDPATPRKYVFPSGTSIAAGGYLVVYADSATTAPGLHTGFALDAEGDQVRLYDTTASGGALLDSIEFGFQIPDFSVARTAAAPGTWALCAPTVGAANGNGVALASVGGVRINEWAGHVEFRLDHDLIELFNPATQPAALGGARLTDDAANLPNRFAFPPLSFIGAGGFLPLYGADFGFGLDGDFDFIFLLGENGAIADQVDLISQPADRSTARTTDGGATFTTLAVPTPGLSNQTALPANYAALLANLRLTELMYQPVAASSAGDYEFIELQNIGTATLDLGGVRFTNGLDYTFPAGTTLAGGAYIVIAKNRTAFLSRYAGAAGVLAPNEFTGALDNSGETLALTLPAPWEVHILRFRYESSWYAAASGGGNSLVVRSASTTAPARWQEQLTWRASSAVNGNPGAADTGGLTVASLQSGTVTATAGDTTRLRVSASGSGAITYQWQALVSGQWVNIAGATAATYTVLSTQGHDSGTYRAVVTASGLTATSDPVVLAVSTPATSAGRLLNLSTRGLSLTGANQLIPGFVVAGGGSKQLLVRAVGPTLGTFGVAGTLADPSLTLKRLNAASGTYADIATNDNWSANANAAAITTTSVSVGAFALGASSLDAALLTGLSGGQYSAVTGAPNNATGVALVELYDADAAASDTRLINLATRGFVGTGGDILISGFVVSAESPKTLLIRVVGPTLGNFGVTDVLANPQMAIYGPAPGTVTDQLLLTNDDWSANPVAAASIVAISTQVGAFALPSGSRDAAMVVTLPPGNYTVQASGVNSTTGVALIEVYIVP